ncbi:MAG: DUF1003 domain-containing protein [Chthoniobacterales bacterium]
MTRDDQMRDGIAASGMTEVMQRNITTLLTRKQVENRNQPLQLRVADVITRFTGSLTFVYIHLVLFGAWIVSNLPGTPLPKFDPTFVVLAMFASVEAIFLSTFVLISQNRMAAQADKRADLDLQVSLLAEHEVTRLVTLVKQIAQKLEIEESDNPELNELEKDVKPENVLDAIEEHQRRIGA